MTSLVPYSDSDEDADETTTGKAPQNGSKRKLAAFREEGDPSSSNKGKVHTSLGISATNPIKGDWLCYCFVPIDQQTEVFDVMKRAYDLLLSRYSQVKPVLDPHISLTKPILIRYHEKDDLLAKAKGAMVDLSMTSARNGKRISLAFSAFTHLPSEDGGRIYLAIEVGLGWQELRTLTSSLSNNLATFHAREYFKEARYHSSFASFSSEDINHLQLKDISDFLESSLGNQLRACPPIFVDKIGIATGSQVHFVDVNSAM